MFLRNSHSKQQKYRHNYDNNDNNMDKKKLIMTEFVFPRKINHD